MNHINEHQLLALGFTKEFPDSVNGFYNLNLNEEFSFTIDFKTITFSLHVVKYGHVKKLTNIKTIQDIKDLLYFLS